MNSGWAKKLSRTGRHKCHEEEGELFGKRWGGQGLKTAYQSSASFKILGPEYQRTRRETQKTRRASSRRSCPDIRVERDGGVRRHARKHKNGSEKGATVQGLLQESGLFGSKQASTQTRETIRVRLRHQEGALKGSRKGWLGTREGCLSYKSFTAWGSA